MPAALVGSIALALSATPAAAVEPRADERPLRALPPSDRGLAGGVFAVKPLAVRVTAPAAVAAGSVKALAVKPLTVTVAAPAGGVPAAVVRTAAVPETYTVQRGDTISAIASRHGLRTADVLALNGLGWRSVIYPGQVLRLTGAAAPPPAPAPAPAAPVAASGTYVVKGGDTVSAIAKRHGLTAGAVLSANGLGWSSIIYPGQKLTIPGGASAPAAAPAAPAAPAPAAPSAPAAPGGAYTVKGGDTISSIAKAHGVTTNAVLSANKLGWSSIIYPGQTIVIPLNAAPAAATTIPGLDAEQTANARTIVRIGRELGVPDRGIAIALGTAMQESWMRNLDWGDRDSLGVFQQRPSYGWGTPEQVRDIDRATRVFYGGRSDPNGSVTRGLLDIPGWEAMTFTQAAQAVQNSAYPDAYAQWEQRAHAWLAAIG